MSSASTRAAFILGGLCGLLLTVLAERASAETQWPEHSVKVIVTFPAGSANDVAARLLADALTRRWGQPVVVENRTGADGTIAIGDFVSGRDDHTLLYTVAGSVTVAPLLFDHLPYDVHRDLTPVIATTSVILTVTVTGKIQAHSLAELIPLARAHSGEWAWASGPTLPRYVFAAFLKQHGLAMNYVTYRDASQPQADLGEGRIHVLVTSLPASSSPVESGKARFLAITNSTRAAVLPDVPTAGEAGYPELTLDGISGLFGWRGMPQALRDRVAREVDSILHEPAVKNRLEETGQAVIGGTPVDFEKAIAAQHQWVAKTAEAIDLKSAR